METRPAAVNTEEGTCIPAKHSRTPSPPTARSAPPQPQHHHHHRHHPRLEATATARHTSTPITAIHLSITNGCCPASASAMGRRPQLDARIQAQESRAHRPAWLHSLADQEGAFPGLQEPARVSDRRRDGHAQDEKGLGGCHCPR